MRTVFCLACITINPIDENDVHHRLIIFDVAKIVINTMNMHLKGTRKPETKTRGTVDITIA